MEPTRDDRLWRIAQKRASFKRSLYGYMVIVAFLWAIWWFTSDHNAVKPYKPWPVWVMLGWGLALGFQYFGAYYGSGKDLAEEEYEKLKKQ